MTDEPTQSASSGEQAPAQAAGESQAAGKAALEKKYTDEDVDRIFNEKWAKKMAALEKKHGKIDDLAAKAAKLEEIERNKLSDEEKKKADLKALQDQIDAKQAELTKTLLREKKRSALDAAKLALQKDVTLNDLLDMMPGGEDDIEASILRFKKIFPEPEPSKAIGGGSQTPPAAKPPDLKEQIATLEAQARDPKTDPQTRDQLNTQILGLKMRAGGFVIT